MAERRCTFKCGDWNCGSYQFNLYKDGIDQGGLCDVHYWQGRAHRAEAQPEQKPRNFCPRCGKRLFGMAFAAGGIHTCTPPEGGHQ